MTRTTAPQRGVLASFATIRTLRNLLVGSVGLLFAMTASAQTYTLADAILVDNGPLQSNGKVTGSFKVTGGGAGPPVLTDVSITTYDQQAVTNFNIGEGGEGFRFLVSGDGPDYTGDPVFFLIGVEPSEPGGGELELKPVISAATPGGGSANISFSLNAVTLITTAGQAICPNADCSFDAFPSFVTEVDFESTPPPTLVESVPEITNYRYSLDGGTSFTGLEPPSATSPVTISGLTNGTTYSIILQAVGKIGNPVGAASDPVEVTLEAASTAPDAPTGLSAAPGDGEVTVAFLPGAAYGAAITNYAYSLNGVDYTPLDPAQPGAPAGGPGRKITIAGLTNGTSYSITLKAITSAGSSVDGSAAVVATPVGSPAPPATPATPAAPTATAGDSQVSVTWIKPADGGSTITGYTVTSAPDGKTCTTSDADTLTCAVTGLTNGTAYTFSVTATNGVGTSAASAASSSVTPEPPVPPVPNVATPVPTSPIWLLGIMAGLLSLVAIRKLRKV